MAPIIRPWRNERELIQVGKWFYRKAAAPVEGKDPRVHACEVVQVWLSRTDVPHTVFSTSGLAQAVLHDEQNTAVLRSSNVSNPATSPTIVANSISSTYTMAIIHFVTGLTDTQQTKRDKVSMYKAAESIGLSHRFVDLRNEAVHEGKVGLVQLREAAAEALEWLWEGYWEEIVGREVEVVEKDQAGWREMLEMEDLVTELDRLVARCIRFSEESATSKNVEGADGVGRRITECAGEVQRLCKDQSPKLLLFADLLTSQRDFQQAQRTSLTSSHYLSYWDKLLLEIAAVQYNFLFAYTDSIVRQMSILPSTSNDESSTEELSRWLLWAWVEEHWTIVRKRSSVRAVDLLASCLASQSWSTLQAAERILNACRDDELKTRFWRRKIEEASALLSKAGTKNISGQETEGALKITDELAE